MAPNSVRNLSFLAEFEEFTCFALVVVIYTLFQQHISTLTISILHIIYLKGPIVSVRYLQLLQCRPIKNQV